MSHVINTLRHKLPYGEILTAIFKAFSVPLSKVDEKKPSDTYFFKETILNMCGLKRENGIWWLGNGTNRRRDSEDAAQEECSQEEEESESREESSLAGSEREQSNSEKEGEDAKENSESFGDFFDAVDGDIATDEDTDTTSSHAQPAAQNKSGKSTTTKRVDPSSAAPDYALIHL
ncbi:hypothetical protein Dimus_001530 [Dionaea muscipula]